MANDRNKLRSICMLSTHGYFDPAPQLGRTDTGGQVVYVLELAKALSRRGTMVDIYTRWFDPSREQVESVPDAASVNVVRIPAGPWEFIPKEQIYETLPELAHNMVAFIRENRHRYDLFHGHYVDGGIVALDVAEALKKPAFFTAHSLGAWKREQMGGDPQAMEDQFRFNHRISEELRIFGAVKGQTLTTEVQREKLEQLYGWHASNIVVIPPGVDSRVFRPLRPREARATTGLPSRYIFCLSRIDSNKGHDLLLRAFDIVRNRIQGVDLIIGGGSPQPRGTELEVITGMKQFIEETYMSDRVHIIGYVPDEHLVSYYQQAELFVLPSIFEPFGMTALESMACAKPVVASKFGGIREVISSGENGLLVDPSNADEFAGAMISLLEDPGLAKRMGHESRKSVERHFSWDAIAGRHVTFYKEFTGP